MTLYWRRNMLAMSFLLLLFAMHLTAADDDATPANSEDEDDSSSEETVEDSNESRRKRSLEIPATENASKGGSDDGKTTVRAGLPGLPDPATILKIAEILQTVGEKVIPILVEGNSAADLVTERISKDFTFLRNFRKEIEMLMEEFTMK